MAVDLVSKKELPRHCIVATMSSAVAALLWIRENDWIETKCQNWETFELNDRVPDPRSQKTDRRVTLQEGAVRGG